MIAVIDYGMGNIHSVHKVIGSMGLKPLIVTKKDDLDKVEKIILPGVGAFADAMDELDRRDLKTSLISQINNKKPFLGICLGMQLLFNRSFEGKGCAGLGVLNGVVNRFSNRDKFKVPHIGWNRINASVNPCKLLEGVAPGSYVYFCHSYYVQPQEQQVIAATTDYGIDFASVVCKDNVFGVQFHPEKSQKIGIKILENFIKLC